MRGKGTYENVLPYWILAEVQWGKTQIDEKNIGLCDRQLHYGTFSSRTRPINSSLRKGNPVGIWFLAHSNAEKYIEKSELRQPLPNLNFPEFKTLFL